MNQLGQFWFTVCQRFFSSYGSDPMGFPHSHPPFGVAFTFWVFFNEKIFYKGERSSRLLFPSFFSTCLSILNFFLLSRLFSYFFWPHIKVINQVFAFKWSTYLRRKKVGKEICDQSFTVQATIISLLSLHIDCSFNPINLQKLHLIPSVPAELYLAHRLEKKYCFQVITAASDHLSTAWGLPACDIN